MQLLKEQRIGGNVGWYCGHKWAHVPIYCTEEFHKANLSVLQTFPGVGQSSSWSFFSVKERNNLCEILKEAFLFRAMLGYVGNLARRGNGGFMSFPSPPISFHLCDRYTQQQAFLKSSSEFGNNLCFQATGIQATTAITALDFMQAFNFLLVEVWGLHLLLSWLRSMWESLYLTLTGHCSVFCWVCLSWMPVAHGLCIITANPNVSWKEELLGSYTNKYKTTDTAPGLSVHLIRQQNENRATAVSSIFQRKLKL